MFQRVVLKESPEVKAIVLAADSTYKKHEASLVVSETCELQGTSWSGGSRSTYTAVDVVTKRSKGAPQYAPPQFGGPQTTPVVQIPLGVVIVETGIFCGKKATAYIHIHPANVAQLLPAPKGVL